MRFAARRIAPFASVDASINEADVCWAKRPQVLAEHVTASDVRGSNHAVGMQHIDGQ
jgi:hypothetical protein